MTLVRRTSPFGDFLTLRQAMDRLFDDRMIRPRAWGSAWSATASLPLDIHDSPDALAIDAALPGFRPDDVEITVEDGTLTIRAESREERQETGSETLVNEIRRGPVRRTVTLPKGLEADKATATFENGVLRLRIPRTEPVKPQLIRITPTTDGHATNGASVEAGDRDEA